VGKTLKEQLAGRPDARERDVLLHAAGGEPLGVTIRRLTVTERDRLIKEYKLGSDEGKDRGMEASIAIVTLAVVQDPPITREDVEAMPAAIVDEVATLIMDFNGWSTKGKRELDDQFRAPAGPSV